MCTITIKFSKAAALVTMNRDEAIERGGLESAPIEKDGMIYPVDGKFGGTWFALNKKTQTSFCLMNRYDELDENIEYISRGDIALKLAAGEIIENLDISPYKPFTLVITDKNGIREYNYNGDEIAKKLHKNEGWHFFSSSSWNADKVLKWREEKFAKWLVNQEFKGNIPSYNLYREKGMEEFSPLVLRSKTKTTSITQAILGFANEKSEMKYFDQLDIL